MDNQDLINRNVFLSSKLERPSGFRRLVAMFFSWTTRQEIEIAAAMVSHWRGLKLGLQWMKKIETSSYRTAKRRGLTRGRFGVWDATVWAGGGGVFLQVVAHGEGNERRVSNGAEQQNRVLAPW
jgi:hypothetical protein